ncbi:glutamine cyclotransferase [Archangium gephyra]|uniref:Glutamine cyclotransferase n=1 Tax=Archangium gephyra TaxID=48 RepID=A0AAC8TJG0_9BACT|nr:glutaminyl-peptide cyclotransferase [Archangium gephyra]AKJ06601.1 Glutamine cyclotransferase [Archangium gephyra]REG32090.1 glutamine cyclotransferase [Archangium gephyra]
MTSRRRPLVWLSSLVLLSVLGCRNERPPAPTPPASTPVSGFEVVQSWPHDPNAYTQGLVYRDGRLYEGTGLHGQSSLREVELETGAVLRRHDLERQHFGEGIALFKGRLYQLTWRSQVGFIYDAATFQQVGRFAYPTEGWGLTDDGTSLIMSDGSSTLRFLDPTTLAVQRTLRVTDAGREISLLNELEFIKGELYANVYLQNDIARIDPATGKVTGWINLSGLLPPEERTGTEDVLNGIAYDAARDRLLVTGKRWPRLFHIRLVPR